MLPWVKKLTKKRTTRILIGLFVVFFCVLFFTNIVSAQTVQVIEDDADTLGIQAVDNSGLVLSGQDIRVVIAKIIRAVLGLLGIIAVVIVIYAGFTIMTSGGNEEKVAQGKKILTNGVIGLAIILMSFIIVQFLLNALADATGMRGGAGSGGRVQIDSFAGSGALGKIIKDHYPTRDQVDVYRNTSIIVTFKDTVPVDPASIINNDNGTCWDLNTKLATTTCSTDSIPYYGDCVDLNGDGIINRKEKPEEGKRLECDTLNKEAVSIYYTTSTRYNDLSEPSIFFDAVALTMYENVKVVDNKLDADNYSFVFVPMELLGSPEKNVMNTVKLTNDILNKQLENEDQAGVFSDSFVPYYFWQFETNTKLDIDPPYVVEVFPGNSELITKNTIVSVQFSEAMNPIMVAGKTNGSDGTSFTNLLLNNYFGGVTTTPSGTWKVSNGYTTAEFIPDEACGLNSCGEMMYCLYVDCAVGDFDCTNGYSALIRTADLTKSNKEIPFEAVPFTGVVDTAFNALDSDYSSSEGRVANGKPPAVNNLLIDGEERNPDNFWWDFVVQNKVDREPPYIVKLTPDIDKYSVMEQDDLNFYYSRRMLFYSLTDFVLEEYPGPFEVTRYNPETKKDEVLVDDNISFYSRMNNVIYNGVTSTVQTVKHRAFGPNNSDLFYFPTIPTTVISANQQCLYPGRGPEANSQGAVGYSKECKVVYDANTGYYVSDTNCVDVMTSSTIDTACMYILRYGTDTNLTASTTECLSKLKTDELSPWEAKQ